MITRLWKQLNMYMKNIIILLIHIPQREIENYIRKKFSEGSIKIGESIKVSMNLSSEDGELNHSIKEDIKIK